MDSKIEKQVNDLAAMGVDIWSPMFHRQYEGAFEGRIRRQYMDLARPPFYPVVFKRADIFPYERVFDLGCGDATDVINLRASGHRGDIVGLETPVPDNAELTETKIAHIEEKIRGEGITGFQLELGYAEEVDLPDESFDTIWAANILQECYDIDKALNNIYRMLAPGGKLVIVTNHADNKPYHHGKLKDMAARINGVPPRPHSTKFNSVTGPLIMEKHGHQFRLEGEVIQRGADNLKLTEQELPVLLASLSTYWYDIRPDINENDLTRDQLVEFLLQLHDKKTQVLREVEQEVLAEINANPERAVYETIKRVGYVYRKRSKVASHALRYAGLVESKIKERSF